VSEEAPRPYQVEAVEAVLEHWREHPEQGAMLVMATGCGKTRTGLEVAAHAVEGGHRVVWLAHRRELLHQPLAALRRLRPDIRGGIVQAARDDSSAQVVFGSVDTLRNPRRLAAILRHGRPRVVVVDECHHSLARGQRGVLAGLEGAHLLGLTATPDREDGQDLGDLWEIAYQYGITDAIRDGWLVPPYAAVSRLPGLDLTQVSGRLDYVEAELAHALLVQGIVQHTVRALAETHLALRLPERTDSRYLTARGRAILVYTVTVEQARLTSIALTEAGWRAEYVSGLTPTGARDRIIADFGRGIEVLCNAAVLTEGTDLPGASVVVLARPTKSWALYCQIVGRGLRTAAGKAECLLIDLVGTSEVLSLVSAPVLVGGSLCPTSPTRAHAYDAGTCSWCGHTVACPAGLDAGSDGSHVYSADHACLYCGRRQCPESASGAHTWISQADGLRTCLDCGAEVPCATFRPLPTDFAPPLRWTGWRYEVIP